MLEKGQPIARESILRKLVEIQYDRSEDLRRGTFRVRGDMIEIYPPYEDFALRIELWGSQIEAIRKIDPVTGADLFARTAEFDARADLSEDALRPARRTARARDPAIYEELEWWKGELDGREKLSKRNASFSARISISK